MILQPHRKGRILSEPEGEPRLGLGRLVDDPHARACQIGDLVVDDGNHHIPALLLCLGAIQGVSAIVEPAAERSPELPGLGINPLLVLSFSLVYCEDQRVVEPAGLIGCQVRRIEMYGQAAAPFRIGGHRAAQRRCCRADRELLEEPCMRRHGADQARDQQQANCREPPQ